MDETEPLSDPEQLQRNRDRMLRLSQEMRSSRKLCPRCGQPTLERVHLAWFLKPIRLFRPLRAYSCISCGHTAHISSQSDHKRRRRRHRH
jgi:transposase